MSCSLSEGKRLMASAMSSGNGRTNWPRGPKKVLKWMYCSRGQTSSVNRTLKIRYGLDAPGEKRSSTRRNASCGRTPRAARQT